MNNTAQPKKVHAACPICQGTELHQFFSVKRFPTLQNSVFSEQHFARQTPCGELDLRLCPACRFGFNTAFDPALIRYDADYQNEQHYSQAFAAHMEEAMHLATDGLAPGARIVEIGCGKGRFVDMLRAAGFDAVGVDPAYEGEAHYIRKTPWSPGLFRRPPDRIVLRHILEHLQDPAGFLSSLRKDSSTDPLVYIEVPCLDWIIDNQAFWDFSYEHCNYFTLHALNKLVGRPSSARLFGGQYLGVLGSLDRGDPPVAACVARPTPDFDPLMRDLAAFVQKHRKMMLWGAGGKGVVLANLLDPDGKWIQGVIDINPAKQGRCIAGAGHRIFAPEALLERKPPTVLIMNDNYAAEIRSFIAGLPPDARPHEVVAIGELCANLGASEYV